MADADRETELLIADDLEKKSNEFLLVSQIFTLLQVLFLIGLLLIPGKEALVWMLGGIFVFETLKFVIRRIRTNLARECERILNEL